jgi:rRNA maturation endonuclease Nob1
MRKTKCKLSAKKKLERELTTLRRSCVGLRSERIKLEAYLEKAMATIAQAKEAQVELSRAHVELQNVRQTLGHVNEELKRRQKDLEPYRTRICRNCKFFFPCEDEDCPECHLHPPTAGVGWPKLLDDDEWCGKFEAK